LKFGRAKAAAKEMAHMSASHAGGYNPERVIVTHVPTAMNRVRQRGYDQAALIAKSFAHIQSLTYATLLARHGKFKQVGASKMTREHQLRQAFRPTRTRRIKGAHIILIDDVVTTGATLQAAAKTLKDAGAKRVEAVVFAQA
jgi:ComF family protein